MQNEQGSIEDVTACVEAVLRTRPGDREMLPDFGTPEPLFANIPIDTDSIREAVTTWEPRAIVTLREAPDLLQRLVDHVVMTVRTEGGE